MWVKRVQCCCGTPYFVHMSFYSLPLSDTFVIIPPSQRLVTSLVLGTVLSVYYSYACWRFRYGARVFGPSLSFSVCVPYTWTSKPNLGPSPAYSEFNF